MFIAIHEGILVAFDVVVMQPRGPNHALGINPQISLKGQIKDAQRERLCSAPRFVKKYFVFFLSSTTCPSLVLPSTAAWSDKPDLFNPSKQNSNPKKKIPTHHSWQVGGGLDDRPRHSTIRVRQKVGPSRRRLYWSRPIRIRLSPTNQGPLNSVQPKQTVATKSRPLDVLLDRP